MIKDYYLVDGYNVLNAWPEFKRLLDLNMEHARESFNRAFSEYIAYKDFEGAVVYDAMDVKGPGSEENIGRLKVVYTSEDETADSWIEKETYLAVKNGRRVFVVTSDKDEQYSVLGSGAYRISALEFRDEYKKTKKEIKEEAAGLPGADKRWEIGSRLDGGVAEVLEAMRRASH